MASPVSVPMEACVSVSVPHSLAQAFDEWLDLDGSPNSVPSETQQFLKERWDGLEADQKSDWKDFEHFEESFQYLDFAYSNISRDWDFPILAFDGLKYLLERGDQLHPAILVLEYKWLWDQFPVNRKKRFGRFSGFYSEVP